MSVLHGWWHRLRVLLRPAEYEKDLMEEMRFHEELDAMQQGDASRARRRFGNRTRYQEEARDMTWLARLDGLRQDLGYAWRSVRRSPGFTVMVVVTLALGLGVNAATFSVLDRLFLRNPEGVTEPGTVRRLWFETSAQRSYSGTAFVTSAVSVREYRAIAAAIGAPSRFALYTTDFALALRRDGARSRVRGVFATASYFPVLGVRAAFGRLYTPQEDSLGQGRPVALLGHRYWRETFGGDSSILGTSIEIERQGFTVIGVLQEGFEGLDLQAADVWIPIASRPGGEPGWWNSPNVNGFSALYRAETPGRDAAFERIATQAQREENRRMWALNPDTLARVLTGPLVGAGPGKQGSDNIISQRLSLVAAIILVIACANVMNLLLARAEQRRREIAVRLALGISRWRLVRLLTAETMLLAAIAVVVALLGAWWGGTVLRSLILNQVTWHESVLHWRVVVFAIAIALAAGFVAGVIPALQASSPALTPALKEGGRTASSRRSRLRAALVITQAALSVTLLAGAALFVESLRNVRGLDIGYDADRLLFGRVTFEPGQSPPAAVGNALMGEIQERLHNRPGVEAISRTLFLPMQGISFNTFWWDADSSWSLRPNSPTNLVVDREFFRAVGMRVVAGRTFAEGSRDREVVINEAMFQRLWGRESADAASALGRCIRFERRDGPCYVVTGVVENARQGYVIEKEPIPQYYLPLHNLPTAATYRGSLVVRTRPAAEDVARVELQRSLARAFPGGEVDIEAMSEALEPEYRPWRLGATLFTAFGMLALVVAMIGIYSTVSYGVAQRAQEFGVRVALGARMRNVLAQVVGEGLRVVAIGVVVGIALALAAGKLTSALLYGVAPHDPAVMFSVSAILLGVAAGATVIPAWRAARVDPVIALRAD